MRGGRCCADPACVGTGVTLLTADGSRETASWQVIEPRADDKAGVTRPRLTTRGAPGCLESPDLESRPDPWEDEPRLACLPARKALISGPSSQGVCDQSTDTGAVNAEEAPSGSVEDEASSAQESGGSVSCHSLTPITTTDSVLPFLNLIQTSFPCLSKEVTPDLPARRKCLAWPHHLNFTPTWRWVPLFLQFCRW